MPNTQAEPSSGTILSGMRPTGQLHLGNYFGALQNWVDLQDSYKCIYTIVDIHALTTIETPEDISNIRPNIYEMALDWLAAGIDPNQSTIFIQSHIPEVMTLNTLLSMVTPLGWLMRVPTFKEMKFLLEKAQKYIEKEKIWVNPDCGLKTRGWPEVKKALKSMTLVAKSLR